MSTLSIHPNEPIEYITGYSYIEGHPSQMGINMEEVYIQGMKDGADEMHRELIKRGNALFELAFTKVEKLTGILIESARANNIAIYEFYLKVENWDCLKSIIIVDMDDFVDEKIETLYKAANEIYDNVNTNKFHWDYSITYNSDNVNIDKIKSDGFTYYYEHISRPRKA